MWPYILIALGGACGALARYQAGLSIHASALAPWPLATFFVNSLGSLGIGVVAVLLERGGLDEGYRQLLIVGFFGAFTTFSTFSLEMLQQMERGAWLMAGGYALASVATCLVSVAAGVWTTRWLL